MAIAIASAVEVLMAMPAVVARAYVGRVSIGRRRNNIARATEPHANDDTLGLGSRSCRDENRTRQSCCGKDFDYA